MEKITTLEFILSIGYVTIISSILVLIITQIIKTILIKTKVINDNIDESKKDLILSRIGRFIAFFIYSSLFILNEYLLHNEIVFDSALLTGLVSGTTLTLSISKALYTTLHQFLKKEDVFSRLEYASSLIDKLSTEIDKNSSKEEVINNLTTNNEKTNKWLIKR